MCARGAQKRKLRWSRAVVAQLRALGPFRCRAKRQKQIFLHVFVLVAPDVRAFVLEKPGEPTEGKTPRCGERNDHALTVVVHAAVGTVAQDFPDFRAAARSDG